MTNKDNQIFNSPVEVGFRTLLILTEFTESPVDIQKLVYLDYFLVHSGDVLNGPSSMHPASPFRSGEIAIKREILKHSLQILHKKSLIEVNLNDSGISYVISNSGIEFTTSQKTKYANSLKVRAQWLKKEFGHMDQSELDEYVSNNIQSWNAEFLSKG